jgi:cellulose synthase/poly-beta-1,6-N-acetylglucosamine synthase-like glycosyltransferase
VLSPAGLFVLIFDIAVIAALILLPLRRKFDDSDKGRGNVVILPPVLRATGWRTSSFSFLCVVGSIALIAIRRPDLTSTYRSLVTHLADYVVRNPAAVADYSSRIHPIIPIAVFAFVVAAAICIPGSLGRRGMILLHAPLALAAALVADTTLAVFTAETHVPLGPFPLISILLHYIIAYTVSMRLAVTTFQLPRPTMVPMRRRGNSADNAILIVVLITVLLLVGMIAVWIVSKNNSNLVVFTFVIIAMPVYLKFGIYALLSFLRLFGNKPPEPTDDRPPLEIIGPAYNEEHDIVNWIEHIDVAAGNYGGPVRVFLTDDGSTDNTAALAAAAFANCEHAQGTIISGEHRGKATALNQALTRCTADYIVRHDTDCVMHPHALLYTVPWLQRDEQVGLVGAFMLPKFPFTTWIDRMRALELAAGFGLPRLAYSVVDCQPCVPGNYTAFRRSVALELGGFTEGMFGEDIDFTCNVARLGYRAVYDRRVWAYEDVPVDVPQLRVQRRRWNRGSIHNFARFIPLAAGSGGPRFWFAEFMRAARRLVMPMQFAAYLFAIQETIFNPSAKLNIIRLTAFYVLAKLPGLVIVICSMSYRGLWKTMFWWPCYLYFAVIKRLANLEALLTLPTRPVNAPWRMRPRADEPVRELNWPVLRPEWLPS